MEVVAELDVMQRALIERRRGPTTCPSRVDSEYCASDSWRAMTLFVTEDLTAGLWLTAGESD